MSRSHRNSADGVVQIGTTRLALEILALGCPPNLGGQFLFHIRTYVVCPPLTASLIRLRRSKDRIVSFISRGWYFRNSPAIFDSVRGVEQNSRIPAAICVSRG